MAFIIQEPSSSSLNSEKPIILQTYRFVFSEEIAEQLSAFAQVHQYDDRKVFKDAWKTWMEEDNIKTLIDAEVKRVLSDGFVGDVIDKMFKSARYYYRKKSNTPKVQPQRKVYEGIPQSILEKMDQHINEQIKANVVNKTHGVCVENVNSSSVSISKISPAESYDNYCAENQSAILQYIKDQNENDIPVDRDMVTNVVNKLKKTYKNRFYKIRLTHNKAITREM